MAEGGAGPRQSMVGSAVRELSLVALLFGVYECGRILASQPSRARQDALDVWRFERWIGLPNETVLQRPFLSQQHPAEALNTYYAWVHFPVTAVLLGCLWWRRPAEYRTTRTVMAVLTFAALAVHYAFPLAPPRMLTSVGMVDLADRYGPTVYGTPSQHSFSDQYAAMPSLHVAWAAVVALAVIRIFHSLWRWLALGYPAVTTAVVLITGNHYWLDAIVGLALLAACSLLAGSRHGVTKLARGLPDAAAANRLW